MNDRPHGNEADGGDLKAQCTATAKSTGKRCERRPRKGSPTCYWHGGAAPQVRAAADRRVAEERARAAVATYGLPREVDPATALLEEVHRTAGHVAWLGALVADLERDELKQHDVVSKAGMTILWEKPAVWLELYQTERQHLARVAKAAVDAGANERVVRVVEQAGGQIAAVIGRILDALELTAEQRALVPVVVPRELRAIAGGEG